MTAPTHRVLRLLGFLEARTSWQAGELAERLGVTEQTVCRDISRLRELGYPVGSQRGVAGCYRLGAGGHLPPLVLDGDEAVALGACLRMAALAGADQVGESALRALAKLDQVLPPRLRAIASAFDDATLAIPRSRPALILRDDAPDDFRSAMAAIADRTAACARREPALNETARLTRAELYIAL